MLGFGIAIAIAVAAVVFFLLLVSVVRKRYYAVKQEVKKDTTNGGSGMKDNVGMRGHISLVKRSPEGKILERREIDNIVVEGGKAEVAALIIGTGTAYTALALGLGSAAATTADTALGSELSADDLERAEATVSRYTSDSPDDTAQLVHEWTSGSNGTVAVTECGAFNLVATAAAIMLGRQVFAAVSLASADKLEVTYRFDID